jgi:signal transduction histidine kinase
MQRTAIIHAEQIRLLYANAPAGFVATVVNVVLLALIQWPVIAPPRLVTWLAAMLALTALRAVVVWRFQRRAPAPPAVRRWGTLFGLGTLGAGLGWGCAGVWLFPIASLPHQVFLAFVVGGMIAGAVGLLSAHMGVFLSFACPAAVPIIVHLLAQDNPMSRTMSGMATLFTLVSIFTAWKLHGTIRASLHLRFDKADLMAAVTAEKARVDASQRLEAEAARRRREAEVLAELARTVNAALEANTILQRVTDGARELCDSDGAAIALCEPGAEAAVICYWAGRPYRGFQGVRIEPGEGIGGLVLATGRPCRTDDYAHDPRVSPAYRAVTQAGGTVAVLVVPIHRGAYIEGILYVGSTRPRTFTDHEEAILQRLADHAAIALHNAQLYANAERRRQSAESLAEVGHLLSQSLDAGEVSQRVVEHVRRLLQTRAAALYQLELDTGMLVACATVNDFEPAATPWRALPPGMGAAGLAVRTRQPVVTADVLTDPRLTLSAAVRAGLEPTPIRAVLALPLLHDGQVIGTLNLADEAGRTFDTEALTLARLFAAQAATALANAQLYTEVQAGRARLQRLSRQLLEAQETERRRMAHELHDETGQLLAAVHLALETTVSGLPPPWREGFHQVRSQLDAMEIQFRRLAHELRPTMLDDLGLLPALQFLAQGVAARTGLDIHVDSALADRLAPAVETALYRIMQEGLTNIAKHAAATHVTLQVWHEGGRVRSLLRDDGVGFVVAQVVDRTGLRGLGLLGIQERLEALGGTLQIISAPGQGTTLQITLPVDPGAACLGAARA